MSSTGKTISDTIIALVHLPTADPNFLHISARNPAELHEKATSAPGKFLSDRHDALQRYIGEAKSLTSSPEETDGKVLTYEQKMVAFLQEKQAANALLYEVYQGKAGKDREQAFYKASQTVWAEGVPDVLRKLEVNIKGPYALGDQVVSLVYELKCSDRAMVTD